MKELSNNYANVPEVGPDSDVKLHEREQAASSIAERSMIEFLPDDYEIVAEVVAMAVGEKSFVADTIQTAHEGFDAELTITLVVYRNPEDGTLRDLVPVWWEMHTTLEGTKTEVLNDFSFGTIRELLCSD